MASLCSFSLSFRPRGFFDCQFTSVVKVKLVCTVVERARDLRKFVPNRVPCLLLLWFSLFPVSFSNNVTCAL